MTAEEILKAADAEIDKFKELTSYKYQEYAGANYSTFEHDSETLIKCAIQARQMLVDALWRERKNLDGNGNERLSNHLSILENLKSRL